jgi:VWFA-related protein
VNFGDWGTSLWDAVAMAAMRPVSAGTRRVVVVFTDGVDRSSVLDRATRLAVVDRSAATIQVVATGSLMVGYVETQTSPRLSDTSTRPMMSNVSAAIGEITSRTGGTFFDLNESRSFLTALGAAIDEFRSRYILRFAPQGVAADGWHALTVTVPGKRYDVRARRGYQR